MEFHSKRILLQASLFLIFFISSIATVSAGGLYPQVQVVQPKAPESHDYAFIAGPDSFWFRPVFTGTGGTTIARVGEAELVAGEGFEYYFEALHTTKHEVIWGAFAGTELPLDPKWFLQVGIAYYQPKVFTPNGILTVMLGDNDVINGYLYSYRVLVRQLLVESKLFWNITPRFHPYITAGLGSAFNKSYAFKTYVPVSDPFIARIADHTITAFSYNIGIGMDVDIVNNIRFGGAYRLSNFGKVSLGNTRINFASLPFTLSQSYLNTQEVVAQLSYLFF